MRTSLSKMSAITFIAAGAVLLLFFACGGPRATVRQIPPEVAARLDRGVTHHGEVGRDLFDDEKDRFSSLVRLFRGGLRDSVRQRFRHDPRLDSVALLVTHAFAGEESRVAPALMEWTVNRMGVVGNVKAAPAWYGRGSYGMQHIDGAVTRFARGIRGADWEEGRYAFGVARLRVPPDRFAIGLVIVEQPAVIKAIPKRVQPGQPIALEGRILGRPDSAVASMSISDLENYGFSLPLDKQGAFSMEIPAPVEIGRHRLSLVSWKREGGAELAVSIPIYVGMDEPVRPDPSMLSPPPNPGAYEDWTGNLLAAINQRRQRAGLDALSRSPQLDSVVKRRLERRRASPFGRQPPLREDLHRAGMEWGRWTYSQRRFEFLAEVIDDLNDAYSSVLHPGHDSVGIA